MNHLSLYCIAYYITGMEKEQNNNKNNTNTHNIYKPKVTEALIKADYKTTLLLQAAVKVALCWKTSLVCIRQVVVSAWFRNLAAHLRGS